MKPQCFVIYSGKSLKMLSNLVAFQSNEFRPVQDGVAQIAKSSSIVDYLQTPFTVEAAATIDSSRKAPAEGRYRYCDTERIPN